MGWSEAVFIIESIKKELEKLQSAINRIEVALVQQGIISDNNESNNS